MYIHLLKIINYIIIYFISIIIRNLVFNNLTGTVPSSFENLTELKYL